MFQDEDPHITIPERRSHRVSYSTASQHHREEITYTTAHPHDEDPHITMPERRNHRANYSTASQHQREEITKSTALPHHKTREKKSPTQLLIYMYPDHAMQHPMNSTTSAVATYINLVLHTAGLHLTVLVGTCISCTFM